MNLIIHQTFKLLISLFIDFLDRGLAVNKEVTEPRFLDAKLMCQSKVKNIKSSSVIVYDLQLISFDSLT
jgi:hypothetical protein